MTKFRGYLTVLGGFLLHFTLGSMYSFGNLIPYVVSYAKVRGHSIYTSATYPDAAWIFALAVCGQGTFMFVGGLLEHKIGPRWTSLLGGLITSGGFALTYLALDVSFGLVFFTNGFLFGAGVGVAYAPPLHCAMKWFSRNKGFISGIIVAGFGASSILFVQLHTAFINPANRSPDCDIDGDGILYFCDDIVLDKVPWCFLLFGGIYAVMVLIAGLLLSTPPTDHVGVSEKTPLVRAGARPSLSSRLCALDKELSEGLYIHPKQALKTREFWTAWLIFLLNDQAVLFISTLYKAYGQTFIADDKFLALVGSFASVCNCAGRILWGLLCDKLTFRTCMLCLEVCMMFFLFTLIITPYGGNAMFLIWICAIYLSFSGNFSLFPTATSRLFGSKYFGVNFGLIFTGAAVTSPIGALLSSTLTDVLGWFGMFSLMAGFTFIGWLLTFSFKGVTPGGQPV